MFLYNYFVPEWLVALLYWSSIFQFYTFIIIFSSSPPTRRRFGENRYSREDNKSRTNFGRSYGGDDEDEDSGRGRFRSRFLRPDDDDDIGSGNRKSYAEDDEAKTYKPERIKVVDTEDASRGPLSGTIRLADSSRIITRLKVSLSTFELYSKIKENKMIEN